MAKLSNPERARLAKALTDGGIKHVTHRRGKMLEEARNDFHQAERLCIDGYRRIDRISGDPNSPFGERAFEYKLTEKGRREARRYLGA